MTPQRTPGASAPLPTAPPVYFASDEPQRFGQIPAAVLKSTDLPDRAVRVLGGLALLASGRGVVRATQLEIASASGKGPRTVQRALAELERAGLIALEDLGRQFRLLYRLRGPARGNPSPELALTGRSLGADRAPKLAAPPDPPKEEERERTTPTGASSSVVSQEGETREGLAELVDLARSRWPADPTVEDECLGVWSRYGHAWARAAVEYATLEGRSPAYAGVTARRWWADGYSLEDAQAAVQARRPRPPVPAPPTKPKPKPEPAPLPTEAEIEAVLCSVADPRTPRVLRELHRTQIKLWVRSGVLPESALETAPSAQKEPPAGRVAKLSPRAAGRNSPDARNHLIVNKRSRQDDGPRTEPTTAAEASAPTQRAREDSNLQPSDSKSATPPAFEAFRPPPPPPASLVPPGQTRSGFNDRRDRASPIRT